MWTLLLQGVGLNFPPLGCGLDLVTRFQKIECGEGKDSNLMAEKPGRHHFNQMIKVNITSDKLCWYVFLDMKWWEVPFVSVVFLPITHNPSLVMRKHQTNPTWGNSIIYLTFQGHENKKRLKNHHRPEGTKKTWWVNSKKNLGLDPGTEKGY